MFLPDQKILAISGDSGLVMWQGLTHQSVSLTDYLSGGYRIKPPLSAAPTPETAYDFANWRYTSVVDLEILHTLDQISYQAQSRLDTHFARDVRPNDLKQGNVILIGATEANPWVELFEPHRNFVFSNDHSRQIMSVMNRAPQDNEPKQWNSDLLDKQHRVYGVVAYLPNLGGNGNALILEGTSMAGTECAWDFVSDDSQSTPFFKKIRLSNGTIPYFEIVLGSNN